jgi:hypothetical protein
VIYGVILGLQIVSTLMLTGVIWTIQLVHYPSFIYVADENFIEFESHHSKSISFIVVPLMIIELVTAVFLLYTNTNYMLVINLLLVLLIWMVTFFLSVPCHKILIKKKCLLTIQKLINTNWLRTTFWSIKSIIFIKFLYHFLDT